MPYALLNGHSIYYEVTGSGHETLMLFNGITMSTATWTLLLPLLEAHYQLIRFDFLGQGQSATPALPIYSLGTQADLAHELLAYLGIDKVHLVGLSYGGMVAQHFAHRYPQRLKTLLLAATLAWSDQVNAAICDSWMAAEQLGGADFRYTISLPWLFSSHYLATIEAQRLMELRALARLVNWDAITRLIQGVKQHDARVWLSDISTPTRVIVGKEDRLTPLYQSELLVRTLANASLEIIPHAGHVLHIEAAEHFAILINQFCQR